MTKNKNLEEFKQELIANIEQRVDDNIIEQTNADLLKKLINNAETETDAINIAALGTTYKRTGFHFDKRLEKISNDIKFKSKNEKLSFVNDPERLTHELIIGDNYDALQNLLITHKGKIDVIYIDPPYGKNNMGKFAKTNYNNSITRDNLLSMLYSRLQLAKRLLTPEGVIFCSIDDKNQAYVKCLFDEVFGEENFVACMSCLTNPGGNKGSYMENTLQYVLVYCKNKLLLSDLGVKEICSIQNFPLVDTKGHYCKGSQLEKWGNADTANAHPNLAYSIYYNPQTKDVICKFDYNKDEINKDRAKCIIYEEPLSDLCSRGYFCIRPRITNAGENGRWRLGEKTFSERLKEDNFIFEKQDNGYKIYEKNRYSENKFVKAKNFVPSNIAQQQTRELRDIFGNKPFDYPKPVKLIMYLVGITSNSSAIILDFFAGSGTTGQAVMELNREDGGNRKFILCNNNEITDTNPNGIAYDVTSKRLKRIMSGECYDGTNDFPWLKNNKPYLDNLNVYEIEKVSKKESNSGETAFDKIDETCYGLPKFENETDKIEWVCQNFENATKMEE